MKKTIPFLLLLAILVFSSLLIIRAENPTKTFHYYSTAADERHYPMLLNLIGSIHQVDFEALDQIAIFDLGLTSQQRELLNTIEKTKVYDVEKVHPNLLTYFKTNSAGREVRGWFAWKPVVIKQSLDLFPYFVYLDSGTVVLRAPDALFNHIKQNGYYVMEIPPHSIEALITKSVVDNVIASFPQEQREFLMHPDTYMIDAGFQGLSREMMQRYVLPVYRLASDFTNFEDDGSAKQGFGAGRHDQTLYSIFARAEKLHFNSQGWTHLKVDGKDVPFHLHWNRADLNDQTTIYRARGDYLFAGDKTAFIHWKEKK